MTASTDLKFRGWPSETGVVASVEVARLRRSLRSLPLAERTAITWLHGLDGELLSRGQIATRMRCDIAHVRRLERRALSRLRRQSARAKGRAA